MVPNVQRDPRRLWMPREDSIARVENRAERREIASVERPVGMVLQFLDALVEAIDRQEERFGICHMDAHGEVERRARLPHRVKSAIVDRDQASVRATVAQIQPERLQDFDTSRAGAMGPLDLLGLKRGIPWLARSRPPRLGERDEPPRVGSIVIAHDLLETCAAATRQVDHRRDALPVHRGDDVRCGGGIGHGLHVFGAFRRAPASRQVGVHVDDRKPWSRDARLRHVKHALWLKLIQRQTGRRSAARRCRRGLTLALGRRGRHHQPCPHERQPFSTIVLLHRV